jgi:hypothetical protein
MSDRLALANAIEEAGIERSKAERAASVIVAAIYDPAATKPDIQASETAVRANIAEPGKCRMVRTCGIGSGCRNGAVRAGTVRREVAARDGIGRAATVPRAGES